MIYTNLSALTLQNKSIHYDRVTNYIASDENEVAQNVTAKVNDFSILAEQQGGIASLLNGQSIMSNNTETKPELAMPVNQEKKLNAEQSKALLSSSTALLSNTDADQLNNIAASAATLMTSHINSIQVSNKQVANADAEITGKVSENSTTNTRSHVAVETGTDITDVSNTSFKFLKVVPNLNQAEMENFATLTMNDSQKNSAISGSTFSELGMKSTEKSGQHSIKAKINDLTGTIAGGAANLTGQGVSASKMLNATAKKGKAIESELGKANKLQQGLNTNQNMIKQGSQSMLQQGKSLNGDVQSVMSGSDSQTMFKIEEHRNNFNLVDNHVQKVRSQSDVISQATNTAQDTINKSFSINSVQETAQADLARADQTVKSEIASIHQQTGKKTHDTQNSLSQTFETIRNSNNSTASSVTEKVR
ncbi:hypothetical protein EHW66_17245 [Erwinia psidii]|uniref:hypothetical protein n=1 Tax=Erwinia psidii TaxID=69224 RepID=UPI00226B0821|nr:hypothetical protein [Erwinia psidii]MCX8966663.1 hypothetical protein [Erwinia psidii]